MASQTVVLITLFLQVWNSVAEIGGPVTLNKLIIPADAGSHARETPAKPKKIPVSKIQMIKPVGASIAKNFVPLTELPPPKLPAVHMHDGRRHMDPDCAPKPPNREVFEGANVELWGDYYEEKFAKTVATIVFPDHIDHKFFEVTTQVPYLTVGPIEAIGYHPSTIKSEHPSECEKIYQDHMQDQYSDEAQDFSEESLEMARMPLMPPIGENSPIGEEAEVNMYEDLSV